MRDINSMIRGNALSPNRRSTKTQYHSQLGLPDKGRAIKGLVVCYVEWLGFMKGIVLRYLGLVPYCDKDSFELKYINNP